MGATAATPWADSRASCSAYFSFDWFVTLSFNAAPLRDWSSVGDAVVKGLVVH